MERADTAKDSGGRLPGRSTREEGEVDDGAEERRIRCQIVTEVVAGIQEKVSMDEGEEARRAKFHAKLRLLTD